MTTLNNIDIKQIIDVASKGVNSVLMADSKATNAKLEKVGDFLVKFYRNKIEQLRMGDEKIIQLDVKEAVKKGKKFRKEILKAGEEEISAKDIEKANEEAGIVPIDSPNAPDWHDDKDEDEKL